MWSAAGAANGLGGDDSGFFVEIRFTTKGA